MECGLIRAWWPVGVGELVVSSLPCECEVANPQISGPAGAQLGPVPTPASRQQLKNVSSASSMYHYGVQRLASAKHGNSRACVPVYNCTTSWHVRLAHTGFDAAPIAADGS